MNQPCGDGAAARSRSRGREAGGSKPGGRRRAQQWSCLPKRNLFIPGRQRKKAPLREQAPLRVRKLPVPARLPLYKSPLRWEVSHPSQGEGGERSRGALPWTKARARSAAGRQHHLASTVAFRNNRPSPPKQQPPGQLSSPAPPMTRARFRQLTPRDPRSSRRRGCGQRGKLPHRPPGFGSRFLCLLLLRRS